MAPGHPAEATPPSALKEFNASICAASLLGTRLGWVVPIQGDAAVETLQRTQSAEARGLLETRTGAKDGYAFTHAFAVFAEGGEQTGIVVATTVEHPEGQFLELVRAYQASGDPLSTAVNLNNTSWHYGAGSGTGPAER